jgi:aspartate aminotransferase
MASLPVDDADRFCQWLLESFSYEGQTVMLAPASGFYGTKGSGRSEVRLAYVLNTDSLNKAMDCLEKALEEYKELEEQKSFSENINNNII